MNSRNGSQLASSISTMLFLVVATVVSQGQAFGQNFATQERAAPEKVKFQSSDGFTLHGSLFRAEVPVSSILMIHQCNRRGQRTGFEELAPMLVSKGFNALYYDSRGFGLSKTAEYSDYHKQDEVIDEIIENDVEAAMQFLKSQSGGRVGSVGIVGASCGTWQSILFAQDREDIATLVFLSGSYLGLEHVENAYKDIVTLPILAIYSEDDRYGTPDSMRDAFAKSENSASKLIVHKGDAHGAALFDSYPELRREIVSWFVRRLPASIE